MRAAIVLAVIVVAGCVTTTEPEPSPPDEPDSVPEAALTVASSAFGAGDEIPMRHSCDADNVSPPLDFGNVTPRAGTLALIMEDPDAPSGTVLHWTFWNLPANATSLPEDADLSARGAEEGQPYRGPCPPDGRHRYFFYAYAVNGTLDLAAGSGVQELRDALEDAAVQSAEMYGTYCRPRAPAVGCVLP